MVSAGSMWVTLFVRPMGLCRITSKVPGVVESFRVTAGVVQVLAVLFEDPRIGWYGLDLMRATGQSSGRLYPILSRLLEAGWVRADWEDVDPAVSGRLARRCYRLTSDGAVVARAELAALHERLRPRGTRPPRAAGAVTITPASGWSAP